jgi:hypothetical protein
MGALRNFPDCSHLPHLSGLQCTAAAYGQARARLPLRLFDLLLERCSSAVQHSLWRKGNSIVIVRSSSMAQAARCPIRRPSSAHLDAAVYPVAELAELYRQCWQVETSLAQPNTTMQMEVLHGKPWQVC